MTRKGSLSISTNAIVVLIVAVVMLGLILAFVTQGFGMIEQRVMEEIMNEPDPSPPSSTNQITINKENIMAGGGDRIGFKFSVLNVDQEEDIDVLELTQNDVACSPSEPYPLTDFISEPIFIEGGSSDTYTFIARLTSNPVSDVYLCRLTIDGVSGSASFRINVQ